MSDSPNTGLTDRSSADAEQPARAKSIDQLAAGHVIENGVLLSESGLWDLQTAFYRHAGLGAWGDYGIPHQITCNPIIARGYAELIVAFLEDCRAAGRWTADQQIRVVELGSGSGRFAFHLLRALPDLLTATGFDPSQVTMTLTDFDPVKLGALSEHPQLQGWRAEGRLDFAVVDAARVTGPDDLAGVLTWGGRSLIGNGPLVLIANYVFDSLPADAVAIRHGSAHDVRVSVAADRADLDLTAEGALEHLQVSWTVDPEPFVPADPAVADVVRQYSDVLDATTVLLPTAAWQCMSAAAQAAAGDTLVLAADKGWAHLTELSGLGDPAIVPHTGCFSVMVDFDALARLVRGGGGTALLPPHSANALVVSAFVLGTVPVPRVRLRYAGLAEGGVDDAFELRMAASAPMTLAQSLATLRLSGWDSQVFLSLFSGLLEVAPGLSGTARHDLAVALDRVWAGWFPIGESADLALCVGLLQSSIGRHRIALAYFAKSLEQRGPNASAWLGAALAHHAMDEPEDAAKAVLEALALEPGLDAARALLVELDSFAGIGV